MKSQQWRGIRSVILKLAVNLRDNSTHPEKHSDLYENNQKEKKTFPFKETGSFEIISSVFATKASLKSRYQRLSDAICAAEMYQVLCVNEFSPADVIKGLHTSET